MRLYISGPISTVPDTFLGTFAAADYALRSAGYVVVNPAALPEPEVEHPAWLDYMRRDVVHLMACDGVATLDGWTDSRGARVECILASGLGLPVLSLADWLDRGSSVSQTY